MNTPQAPDPYGLQELQQVIGLGATITEAPSRPEPPRDFALEIAINQVRPGIEQQLAAGISAFDQLQKVNKEIAQVDVLLDGLPYSPGLRARYQNELAAWKNSPGRHLGGKPPPMAARLAKTERRRLELEAMQTILIDKEEQEDRRRAKQRELVEAEGRSAQEAKLLAQFRAEEAEAAAAAEREQFQKWKSDRGL